MSPRGIVRACGLLLWLTTTGCGVVGPCGAGLFHGGGRGGRPGVRGVCPHEGCTWRGDCYPADARGQAHADAEAGQHMFTSHPKAGPGARPEIEPCTLEN